MPGIGALADGANRTLRPGNSGTLSAGPTMQSLLCADRYPCVLSGDPPGHFAGRCSGSRQATALQLSGGDESARPRRWRRQAAIAGWPGLGLCEYAAWVYESVTCSEKPKGSRLIRDSIEKAITIPES
jgi:hypothetical protein